MSRHAEVVIGAWAAKESLPARMFVGGAEMLWVALMVLFVIPIYYQAHGKGYDARLLAAIAAITPFIVWGIFIATRNPMFLALVFVVPPVILGVLVALRPRPGAPGTTISFECPNCHLTIRKPRSRSGLADVCPICQETLTVPRADEAQEPVDVLRKKPDVQEGTVVFASYADPSAAECLASVLLDSGVHADVWTQDSSGVLPPLIASTWRVVIDIADWDRAVEIEQSWIKTAHRR